MNVCWIPPPSLKYLSGAPWGILDVFIVVIPEPVFTSTKEDMMGAFRDPSSAVRVEFQHTKMPRGPTLIF